MRATKALLTVGTLIMILLSGIPSGQAYLSDVPIVGIYLRNNESKMPVLGFSPATEATPTSLALLKGDGTLVNQAPVCPQTTTCTPPVVVTRPCANVAAQQPVPCLGALLASRVVPTGFTTADNSVLHLWLKSDNPTLLESIQVVLQRKAADGKLTPMATFGLDTGQSAEVRPAPIQLGTAPVGLTLGSRFATPVNISGGESLQLLVSSVKTLASTNTPAPSQVYVVYGQKEPTGILLPVAPPESVVIFSQMQRGENTMGLYLGNGTLDFARPTNETVRARTFTGTVAPNGATDMLWGTARPDENSTIVGNAIYTIFARVVGDADGPGALANLAIRVSVHVNKTVFTATSHVMPTALQNNGEAWFVGAVPIPRTNASTDNPINVGIAFIGALPNGNVEILWGSAKHPSGLLIPVEGGGHYFPPAVPKVNVTVPKTPATPNATPPSPTPPSPSPEPESSPEPNEGQGEGEAAGENMAGDPKQVSKASTPAPALPLLLLASVLALAAARRRK